MTQPLPKLHIGLLWSYGFFTIACIVLSMYLEFKPLLLAPALIPAVWIGLNNFPQLYYILLFFLPLSMEFSFTPSLGTDLPSEPLMIGLMLVTFFYLIKNQDALPQKFYKHPLLLLLFLHLGWIFIATLNALNFTVSVKIFTAKIWYITVFVFLTAIVINSFSKFQKAFWCIFFPLLATAIVTMIRHANKDFGFEDINRCVTPYFANHVNYALMLVVFYPFIWLATTWYEKHSWQWWILTFAKVFFIIAIYFSYTRAAMAAAVVMIPFFFIIKWRFMKVALAIATIVALAGVAYMVDDNRFLKHAPEFDSTIYHDEFSDHMSATFEGKDVSSMERIYRWIAGGRMIMDRPLMGVGPGNFYPYYKKYAVASFETWVSDNEERSTIHNYFLLLFVEQGILGLLIFLAFTAYIFLLGENLYHQMANDYQKNILMAVMLSLMAIYLSLTLNDMLESDKIGTLFFFNVSLLLIFATKPLLDSKRQQS
jgi:O-antigen ligase